MKNFKIYLCTIVAFVSIRSFATVSPEEKKILEDLDGRVLTEGIAFLKKSVEINSGTLNRKGVETVGKLYEERLKKLGFKISWIDLATVRRSFHLFAEHK